ncbi:MAG: hypothetical protein KDA29_02155 [Phycisphaerales bacterium]|nr:hypothetical protein [Phycisphaerales bacterium]
MSSTFANAWGWSLRLSPLLAIWRAARGVIRPNREAFAMLDRASLPKQVDEVIRTTVARTKLWRDEREQITRELISHAQDAIGAGRDASQIVGSFGDPKRVAKLMRRSMKRKRPISWQLYRFSKRTVGVLLLVLFVSYIAVVVRFYTSEPQIKVDYGAILSSRNDGYREDQKSWSTLVESGVAWAKLEHELAQQQAQRDMDAGGRDQDTEDEFGAAVFPYLEPDHPEYEAFKQAVRGFAPHLQDLRSAAERPIIGLPVGYAPIIEQGDGRTYVTGIVSAKPDEYKEQSLIGVQLIHLGSMRRLSQVLIFDARLALSDGDTGLACENYIAALGLARQARNEPFLISELVGMAIHNMVAVEIARQLRDQPGLFDSDQLTQLAHTHARLIQLPGIELSYERMYFRDTLQRTFSDDGHGNGRMTPEAFEYFGLMSAPFEDFGPASMTDTVLIDRRVRAATMPLSIVFSNSREQERALHDAVMDETQLVLDQGVQWISTLRESALIAEKVRAEETPMRFSFAALITPAMGSVVTKWFEYQHTMGSFSVMIALEAYRAEHGQLPATIDDLHPSYLPEIPLDLMDPGNPLKYIFEGDRYVIYSTGSDGDDDHARLAPKSTDPYVRNQERQFGLRYPQAESSQTHKPIYEPGGKPKLDKPQGPDGDWILIDIRPEPEHASES